MVSCKKDHDIPTGTVFNGGSGGGSTTDSLTISVTANPSEGGTVSGGGKYLKGKTCVVAASANEGYVFSNWTENGTQVSSFEWYKNIFSQIFSISGIFWVSKIKSHK